MCAMYVCTYVRMYGHAYVCTLNDPQMCISICMYVCAYVHVCLQGQHTYVFTHTYLRIRIVHMYTHMYKDGTHTYIHIYVRTY